ncbi:MULTISPECIES: helix-turn-helix domain-containing protein [unclassified Achromobacter]|uniref:helix-turn-helix domain-containing protein n=1 Tax=unclassified Achromobacter TaxID=2626865 RepID=UPI000B51DC9A|nr:MULTISPECIES: helix-turn-helix domain-containing protein [unclassified Achromobacter]OWT73564.1 AraC family transcriptional regulator [Achromobacter sp. HZ34]OWT79519.1 AraC family transcriptional regulator [Achromobacter sp. HZ28]
MEHLRTHYTTLSHARADQLLYWRDRLSALVDLPVTRAGIAEGFAGTVDAWRVGDLAVSRSDADPMRQDRTIARISTDPLNYFVFHVLLEGEMRAECALGPRGRFEQRRPGIVAMDSNQISRLDRAKCRVLLMFVPRYLVQSVIPDGDALHGRLLEFDAPEAALIPAQLLALWRALPSMDTEQAYSAIRDCALLILAAFGRTSGFCGDVRVVQRTALFGHVRRYIETHLHAPQLTPEMVLEASEMSRPTLYRLFEHEGGLAAYIRGRRLRMAAATLSSQPGRPVSEVAYSLGFQSAAAFNHAFRRAFALSPREFRAAAEAEKVARAHRPRHWMAVFSNG